MRPDNYTSQSMLEPKRHFLSEFPFPREHLFYSFACVFGCMHKDFPLIIGVCMCMCDYAFSINKLCNERGQSSVAVVMRQWSIAVHSGRYGAQALLHLLENKP